MMYFYNKKYILPLSHDEVVHGKATIIQKMNSDYEQEFPQARALYLYMLCHPGKKLNFMGNEIAQFKEWDKRYVLDWDLLKYPNHDSFHNYIKVLNRIYLDYPALYADDFQPAGFEWPDCHCEEKCVYGFIRRSEKQMLLAVFNFSDKGVDYKLKTDKLSSVRLLIDSNEPRFGGNEGEPVKPVVNNDTAEFRLTAFSGQLCIIE